MINLFIFTIYLISTFSITVICYKKYGRVGLFVWMCVSTIICNIQTVKMIDAFGLTTSLGNISYGAIFLTTDILSEKYGEKDARRAIIFSFLTLLIFTLSMSLFLQYNPSRVDTTNDALKVVFNYLPRITIASLINCILSQFIDARVYKYLKEKYDKLWISNNGSTIISQITDTVIFATIAFVGVLPLVNLVQMAITTLIFKVIIALLDTPFLYFVSNIKMNEELQ